MISYFLRVLLSSSAPYSFCYLGALDTRLELTWNVSQSPGDAAGQLTAAPPTCPGGIFTFRCKVTGDRSGITIWRVGRSSECTLVHRSTSSSICGPSDAFTAVFGAGFGTDGPSFISTLSGTLTPAMNGALVECFGPGLARNAENKVGDSILQILGLFIWLNAIQQCVARNISMHSDQVRKSRFH